MKMRRAFPTLGTEQRRARSKRPANDAVSPSGRHRRLHGNRRTFPAAAPVKDGPAAGMQNDGAETCRLASLQRQRKHTVHFTEERCCVHQPASATCRRPDHST
ncbi:hypothetical protein AAFF_G00048050 [Aldrovandia affinis]|uniref:Uncharacterized protein n=1 Tax=Aldrovandia affinis TaxID=143900 RepID=A0AAD7S1W5_9TELE|nr:hypothetical protein AAFF_G00048050 [Aldrovandia affinis]